jgi:hypothetical protein
MYAEIFDALFITPDFDIFFLLQRHERIKHWAESTAEESESFPPPPVQKSRPIWLRRRIHTEPQMETVRH